MSLIKATAMRLLNSKTSIMRLRFLIILVLCSGLAQSQILSKDTTHKWFIPTHAISQFAGDLGFISVGAGYSLNKNRLTVDFLVGYLPEAIGEINLLTLNTKTAYRPWFVSVLKGNHYFVPIQLGLYSSYAFGEQYTKLVGEDYPDDYYWWTTRTRYGITLGQSIFLKSKPVLGISAVEIYYELGTNDFLLFSMFENEEITIFDISHFDFGLRLYF